MLPTDPFRTRIAGLSVACFLIVLTVACGTRRGDGAPPGNTPVIDAQVGVPPGAGSVDSGSNLRPDARMLDAARLPDVRVFVACAPACGASQICQEGTCIALPATCPCPRGAYCDLSSNTCRPGCLTDPNCDPGLICEDRTCRVGCRAESDCAVEERCSPGFQCVAGCTSDVRCNSGRICEAGMCRNGCRSDDHCGPGNICDAATNTCRTGCRTDTNCPESSVCEPTTAMCRPGCRSHSSCPIETVCGPARTCIAGCDTDARCNPGRICDGNTSLCRLGCRTGENCPSGMLCNPTTFLCEHGCDTPERCPVGQACTLVNLAGRLFRECREECSNAENQCRSEPGVTRGCFSLGTGTAGWSTSACVAGCTSSASCSGGKTCQRFTTSTSFPGDGAGSVCALPCDAEACTRSVGIYGVNGTQYPCECRSDGTCGDPNSSLICYRTDTLGLREPSCITHDQSCHARSCCPGLTCSTTTRKCVLVASS